MADFSTPEGLAAFAAEKQQQLAWALASGLPGLQSAATGRAFALTISTDDIYETVHIGQVPREEVERVKARGPDGKRIFTVAPAPEERKQLKNRAIDLTDEQVVAILDRWSENKSALGLPFVRSVWDRSGREIVNQ